MNVFQWDLRNAPGFDPPGFRNVETDCGLTYKGCLFPDTSDGPTILPGTYAVTLKYGDQALQAPVAVELDPRLHPAPGDLEARLALEKQILDAINVLDRSIADALTARATLPPARQAAIDLEVENLVMLHMTSSEADLLHPLKIREQLGFLMNALEGAYQKPTAAEYAAFEEIRALAVAGEERLGALSH